MGFAAAGLSEEQDGPVLFDEPQGGEIVDEFSVDGGLELEVEVVDGSPVRELGVSQSGGESAVSGVAGLFGNDPGEVFDMRPSFGCGLF